MIQLVAPEFREAFARDVHTMFQLRYRVFKERLDWDVQSVDGKEVDVFDDLGPHYLLLRNGWGGIEGCVRLLPSTGPTMLGEVFPELLEGQPAPSQQTIWESSRFAVDLDVGSRGTSRGLTQGTYELFAAMIEFGLSRRLTRIVTVTDVRMERILRRADWPLERFGPARMIGKTKAVAGFLDVTHDRLEAVRKTGDLVGPALWAPLVP